MNAQYPQEPHHPSDALPTRGTRESEYQQTALILSDSTQVAQQVGQLQLDTSTHQAALREVSDWQHLELARETYGVALIDASAPDLMTHLQSLEKQLPLVSPILLSPTPNQDTTMAANVDWLNPDASQAEWQSRLNRAMALSHTRHQLNCAHMRDEIGQVYNYRYFIKRLNETIARSRRHHMPVSCIVLDIAFYRVLVDSYGYGFVSDLLGQVAECVVRTVREEDMVARLGDSEIGILLMHSPAEGAREMTKRLIRELESLSFYNGDQVEHIHLCAGIASYPMVSDMNVNADGLIRYARHALHQARLRDDEAVMEEGGQAAAAAQQIINVEIFNSMRPFI